MTQRRPFQVGLLNQAPDHRCGAGQGGRFLPPGISIPTAGSKAGPASGEGQSNTIKNKLQFGIC